MSWKKILKENDWPETTPWNEDSKKAKKLIEGFEDILDLVDRFKPSTVFSGVDKKEVEELLDKLTIKLEQVIEEAAVKHKEYIRTSITDHARHPLWRNDPDVQEDLKDAKGMFE